MGLVSNIELWNMSAAICMATEGIRANYNMGAGGGGFGAADREIGTKLDAGKILAAVDKVGAEHQHLADWSLFAYSAPGWNAKGRAERLFDTVLLDWVCSLGDQGIIVQEKTYNRMQVIIPFIAGGVALEQSAGASVVREYQELKYIPVCSRKALVDELVKFDCQVKQVDSESFIKKRKRYYQNNWSLWQAHVDEVRSRLLAYDLCARKLFKKVLETKNMAN